MRAPPRPRLTQRLLVSNVLDAFGYQAFDTALVIAGTTLALGVVGVMVECISKTAL